MKIDREIKPEEDIYKALRKNFITLYGILILTICVCVSAFVFSYKVYTYNLNHLLTIDKNGEELPLKMVERAEKEHILLKDHIRNNLLNNFYEYDFNNYKNRIDKALFASDESLENLYLKRLNEGWFDKVKQFNIRQEIEGEVKIKIISLQEPFNWIAEFKLNVLQGTSKNTYMMRCKGSAIITNQDYPNNPKGFLIVRYVEDLITQINE